MRAEQPEERRTGLEADWLGRWILRLPAIERPILFLRWFSLLLVLGLHFFDTASAGMFLPTPTMIIIVAGYYALLLFLMRYVRWLRGPLNYLAVDTVVATVAVYLTGGYHSSFFVLYFFITIGAAFHLDLTRTVMVSLGLGLIQAAASFINPAGLQSQETQIIISAKFMGLLIVGVLCGLLLEQLRREHQETERERTLARRLGALNDLFQQLNSTLDLGHTLQTVSEAPRLVLDADSTGIALLDDSGQFLMVAASMGVDAAIMSGQQWPIAGSFVEDLLVRREPHITGTPAQLLGRLPAEVANHPAIRAIQATAFVPLLLEDRPLGVLGVLYSKPRQFSEEDLAFLHALGQEAALAIRNARLYGLERERVAQLRDLGELQDAFLSSVSHELRTPLTCIKTSVDLLRATRSSLNHEQIELVRTMGQHVGRLEALVNDLLEVTRLEAGKVALSVQPTDLRDLVGRAVEALRPLTARKGQAIDVELPEAMRPLNLDRRRIEQVLTNILANAIKFTPKRGRIRVAVQEMAGSQQVCIADNGPGISDEDKARLFERFYVVTDGRGLSGVGLGLYIARQMVELHGGRIWVESQVGRGSTFCFSLPAAEGNEDA